MRCGSSVGAVTPPATISDELRRAFEDRDLDRLGALFTDDVRWGDDNHPRTCRNRADVVATFARLMAAGVTGRVTDAREGPDGVLCHLSVDWPDPGHQDDRSLFHVYALRDGRICEIRRFDDRASAEEAAGLAG